MKYPLILTLMIWLIVSSEAQTLKLGWVNSIEQTNVGDSRAIITDNLDNVYVTGYFSGSVDFDPGEGVLELNSNGFSDVFLQKLDPSGNLIWAKSFGGLDNDYGFSITVDDLDNVYLTGYLLWNSIVEFETNSGSTTLSSPDVILYVLKLNSLGDFQWVKPFFVGNGIGTSIAVDTERNLYLTGFFETRLSTDLDSDTNILESNGSRDIFMLKLNESGELIWAKSIGGSGSDQANSMLLDSDNNIYITGRFSDSVNFDPSTTDNVITSKGSGDIFILKLDQQGNFSWVKSIGESGNDMALSIAQDSDGNVLIAGQYNGTIDANPGIEITELVSTGQTDAIILKLDESGEFIWARSLGGTGNDGSASISVDLDNNIYFTGNFQNPLVLGNTDLFLGKLDPMGTSLLNKTFANSGYGGFRGLSLDKNANIYITGLYSAVDFNPGADSTYLDSGGNENIVVLKLIPCVSNAGSASASSCSNYTWSANHNTFTSSGIYTALLTNRSGCDSIATLNLTISSINDSIQETDGTLSTVESEAGYQWINCTDNTFIDGEINQSFKPVSSGGYAVAISKNECEITSECFDFEIELGTIGTFDFNMYPNPTNGNVNIKFGVSSVGGSYEVINLSGKVISTGNINTELITINLDEPNGLYFVKVITSKGSSCSRLLKR